MIIKRLTPDLAEDFTNYFESLPFKHAPHWAGCFCRFYHKACSLEEWQKIPPADNKSEALAAIRVGEMKGYLAYENDQVIGWLNANDITTYKQVLPLVKDKIAGKKVGGMICFVIHPDHRNKGVASALCRQAIKDFEDQNFHAIMAMPFVSDKPETMYRGFPSMFEKEGFQLIEKHDTVHVMWKNL